MTKPARPGLGIARRGRVMAVLVVVAVGLTMVAGGAASAKDSKPTKADVARILKFAQLQAKADANTREYTGTVDGTNAYIAVVVSGKDVRVYICDSAALSAWAVGKVATDGTFAVEAASGLKVAGTVSDTAASGTVTLADGSPHAFTAPLATSPAGLYERLPAKDANGQVVVAATIVLADGTQRGAAAPISSTLCANIERSRNAWRVVMFTGATFEDRTEATIGYLNQTNNSRAHGCDRTLV